MNKKITILSISMALSLVSACASSGTQVTEHDLSGFQKGKTTYNDVIAKLGAPNVNSLMPDSSREVCYTYAQYSARPESFIPIVGGFVGGADTRTNNTCFLFSQAGVLKSFTSTGDQFGTGTGFEAGAPDGRISAEPKKSDSAE